MEWFRLWHDFFDDPKLKRLTKAQRYDIAHLFRLASGNAVRGQIDLDVEDMAAQLDLSADEMNELLIYMERKSIVAWGANGSMIFLHWPERQPVSDSGAERMRAYRARQKRNRSEASDEPLRNGDVTVTHREEKRREEKRREGEPPTIEQVRDYAKACGQFGEADKYFNHRASVGWHRNRQSITDWQADFRYWCSNGHAVTVDLPRPQKREDMTAADKNLKGIIPDA